jgi:hypothetical protein
MFQCRSLFGRKQINDLLKSLVLQDYGGGKISPVSFFGSRDPLERTLKSFAIDITDNPPLAEVLNRMRGVEAEIAGQKKFAVSLWELRPSRKK